MTKPIKMTVIRCYAGKRLTLLRDCDGAHINTTLASEGLKHGDHVELVPAGRVAALEAHIKDLETMLRDGAAMLEIDAAPGDDANVWCLQVEALLTKGGAE